jgi:predicted dehydrogenase
VYCINAARYVFREEPLEVIGVQLRGQDPRFLEVDSATTALLRFPGDRLAQFTCSQGAASVDSYRIVGTQGHLRMEPAYSYYGELERFLTIDEKTKTHKFAKRDQFAPELLHFSRCILEETDPEPSGYEGLADVRVMEAIAKSAKQGEAVTLGTFARTRHPDLAQEIAMPPVKRQTPVRAPGPTR